MAGLQTPAAPLVLESVSIRTLIQYLLAQHATSTTLVVCTSKQSFERHLYDHTKASPDEEVVNLGTTDRSGFQSLKWTLPTLRLLASSRSVKLAFCPDVTHLRAYLATHPHRHVSRSQQSEDCNDTSLSCPILAVVSPIELHKPTSAFSAQGLNRTFGIAVEAAYKTNSKLIVAECPFTLVEARPGELPTTDVHDASAPTIADESWDEDVSILNVTTKTFSAGDRGWVGRTVKIRTIAARWFKFESAGGIND